MDRTAKICHLTSAHSCEDVRIFMKECRTLSGAGYEVHLVAPSKDGAGEYRNGDVFVHLVDRCTSRAGRFSKVMLDVVRAARRIDADIYHFHDPELIVAGVVLKLGGKRVVYDVHEDLKKSIADKEWIPLWQRSVAGSLARAVELAGSKIFDGIIAATPSIGGVFSSKKTKIIQNFPWKHEFDASSGPPYSERDNHFSYVGDISKMRGINEMVVAMEHVPDDLNARLLLVGSFNSDGPGRELTERSGWSKVEYQGWKPRGDVAAMLKRSRAGLILFHPRPNHVEAMPNKLFEYMSAGLPVIASDFPLWRDIVEMNKCGLLVDPMDPKAIADAMIWMIRHPAEAEHMGMRGLHAVQEKYNWDIEAQKLLTFYKTHLTC